MGGWEWVGSHLRRGRRMPRLRSTTRQFGPLNHPLAVGSASWSDLSRLEGVAGGERSCPGARFPARLEPPRAPVENAAIGQRPEQPGCRVPDLGPPGDAEHEGSLDQVLAMVHRDAIAVEHQAHTPAELPIELRQHVVRRFLAHRPPGGAVLSGHQGACVAVAPPWPEKVRAAQLG
jgi:hypothetical protein